MTREYMINMIILFTGWDSGVFRNMSDEKVKQIYMERVEKSVSG